MNAVQRGTLLRFVPGEEGQMETELIEDGVVVVNEQGEVVAATSVDDWQAHYADRYASLEIEGALPDHSGLVFLAQGTADTHNHVLQRHGVPGQLFDPVPPGEKPDGWLPKTLNWYEAPAKANPEGEREYIRQRLQEYLKNGITASLQYVTSSARLVEIVLEEAEALGLKDRVKAGYVCMDQNIEGLAEGLQVTPGEALQETERLLKTFGSRVVVIDRFPIAVSSGLRKELIKLARRYGVLYETHLDESAEEKRLVERNEFGPDYGTQSIVSVLLEDGLLEVDQSDVNKVVKVGLAHAIHTTPQEMEKITQKIKRLKKAGYQVELYIRGCPDSNAVLKSQEVPEGLRRTRKGAYVNAVESLARGDRRLRENPRHIPFPYRAWEEAGAVITLGLDNGAGHNMNLFAEMDQERARAHDVGGDPSYRRVLEQGTVKGLISLGIDPTTGLKEGGNATFVGVRPPLGVRHSTLMKVPPEQRLEQVAAWVVQGGKQSGHVEQVWVDGVRRV